MLEANDLSWGVQYELARGVNNKWWSWSDVNKKLDEFADLGSLNRSAPLVPGIMGCAKLAGSPNHALW